MSVLMVIEVSFQTRRVVFLKYVISPKAFTGGARSLSSFNKKKKNKNTQTHTKNTVCSDWRFSDETQIEPNCFQAFYLSLHFNLLTHPTLLIITLCIWWHIDFYFLFFYFFSQRLDNIMFLSKLYSLHASPLVSLPSVFKRGALRGNNASIMCR